MLLIKTILKPASRGVKNFNEREYLGDMNKSVRLRFEEKTLKTRAIGVAEHSLY